MNKLFLIIALICLTGRLPAQTLAETYAPYGQLIVVKLDSAPFPHPARAKGHTYDKKLYTQEKNYSDNRVAIFVPRGFRPTESVDFVVHFYGWRHHIETTLTEYKLIEQLVASGRNAILVVPQGPYDAPDSFDGKMEDENGFKHMMNDIVATLEARGVIHTGLIGKIIITGHSGGGDGALPEIIARGGLSDEVKEVWLFDALYTEVENYPAWYKKYPKCRIVDIYTQDGGTAGNTKRLEELLKASKPPIPFLAKNEADLTPADLRNNRIVFILSALAHDHVVYERNEYCEFLKTSGLGSIKRFESPKGSGR
jgi:hypothetical protein